MLRNLLIAATLVSLSACSQQEPAPSASAPATTAAAATPATTADAGPAHCPDQGGYQVVPSGIILTMRYHLRSDRIYTAKNGQERRRVVLEFLDGTLDSTLSSADASMVAGGFHARPRRDGANGNLVIPYAKKGFVVQVIANPTPGDKPANPAAKGTVSFDYPTASS